MLTLGLTGGMGSGKGYCSQIFARYGIKSIDTDIAARDVVKKGQPCLEELVANFGTSILDENGELIRHQLAKLAFSSVEKTKLLNSVTHKYILEECRAFIAQRREDGDFACIVDAPLLFESHFNSLCDYVIAVTADTETRLERVYLRDGLSAEDALIRFDKQHTNDFFRANSDFIISNGKNDNPEKQIEIIIQKLKML